MHLVYHPPTPPPESNVFKLSWDSCNTQEELNNMVMQNMGYTKCIMNNVEMVNVVSYISDVPASLV